MLLNSQPTNHTPYISFLFESNKESIRGENNNKLIHLGCYAYIKQYYQYVHYTERDNLHYIKRTDPLTKNTFDKNGPTNRELVINPRHHTPQWQQPTETDTNQQSILVDAREFHGNKFNLVLSKKI